MPYADSSFFLALLRKEGWLKQKALYVYEHYKNDK